MKPKKRRDESLKSAPWAGRLGDDCRELLEKLEGQKWNPDAAYALLKGPLHDVITSLHFNSHQRWGLQVKPEEIRHLAQEFLEWMNRAGRWQDWKSSLEELKESWPLRYFLARFFVRFQKDMPLRNDFLKDEPSFSSRRSLLDLRPTSELSQQITESTMAAFANLTQRLPQKNRLVYDLHLEGLLDDEIGALSGHSVEEVAVLVKEAKEFLLDIASGGDNRREGT